MLVLQGDKLLHRGACAVAVSVAHGLLGLRPLSQVPASIPMSPALDHRPSVRLPARTLLVHDLGAIRAKHG